MATDWLDGAAARRWNAVSTAGKLLDPFADALFCMIVFYVFARPHTSQGGGEFVFHMPLWGLGILIAREALVTFVCARRRGHTAWSWRRTGSERPRPACSSR